MRLHARGEQVGGGLVVGFVHGGEQGAAGEHYGFLPFDIPLVYKNQI